jgi:glutamine synthetase
MASVDSVLKLIKDNEVEFIDLRFTDTHGKEQHVSIPSHQVDKEFFKEGKMFDGSSIEGWKSINESDMVLMPDPEDALLDPFREIPTLNLRCDVLEPATMAGYDRDPRSVAHRAEAYLKSTGIGDDALFGPEPEFFIFDEVHFDNSMEGCFYSITSEEADWATGRELPDGNRGHRPRVKGGYFPVSPVDSFQDMRSEMCQVMEEMGLVVEAHHHEVATAGQNEVAMRFNTLARKADEVQVCKYVVHNIADAYSKTATFMPKPLVGDNGSGMHCHQSITKGGKNIFAGEKYAGLSQEALWYIGGIIKHAKALNAFTNASTNSYKRLVPGFEAPVLLAYSACNRSASIRVPHVPNPKGRRIEVRFPDCTANPYLAFSAMLMAGLDGIQNKIDPGESMDKNLYDLPPEELEGIPTVAASLEEALVNLDHDREFLKAGGVFTDDTIDAYIDLKMRDVERLSMATHPVEFDMYYSV